MRRALAAVGCLALLVLTVPVRAAGPAVPRLSPEARERFAAALGAYRAQDWAQAARELGDVSRIASPIAEYALLHQAESLARLGDASAARAAALQAADAAPDSRAAAPALLLAAEQASRIGDDAGAAGLWRRFLDRFPDDAQAPRARLRMGQSLAAAGRAGEAAVAFRDLWLSAPATPQADAAARELRALEARGLPVAPLTPVQRVERAERLAAAGVGDQARTEAEAVLAGARPVDLTLRALRVVVDGARRSGRDDVALAAVNRGLGLSPADKRAPWLLESAKIQQRKNRDGAIAAVDRLAADSPKAPEVPEALLLKARLLESGPDPKSAEPAYLRLAHGYPESEEGLRAAWRLGWLSWLRAEYAEAAERWGRIQGVRTASPGYRDASMYWIGRTHEQRGDAEGAARQFANVVAEAPRSYYGVLAARRAPRAQANPARNPASAQLAASLPVDPRETLQADAPYARVEALRAVGLGDFADEEMDEAVRGSTGDPRRLYALSAAYAQEARHFQSLRILRRHFIGLARSAPPSLPRAFWDFFYPLGWRTELNDAATRAALDPYFVAAVVREESSFDPQARSRVGARGLMQLMPDTARQLAKGRGLPAGDDMLADPGANLALGSLYLAGLMKEFGEPRLAIAAYNAGPARVREWWKARATDDVEVWVELIPFDETRFFVRRVMLSWEEYRRLYGAPLAGARP
ncbi:MAG TPA: lytic transglycosylase domain-containing protein [Methylomirabilota bacterium]|nr:lytic transglycosylase domain-containing protein [Methylomirabilota bacterium]